MPGEFQVQDKKNLLKLNPSLKTFLEKQTQLDFKKLRAAQESRMSQEREVSQNMVKYNKKIIKQF